MSQHAVRTDPALRPAVVQRVCACGCCGREEAEKRQHLQPKLTLGRAGDRYEQEADRVAEQVVCERPVPVTGPLPVTPLVQRQPVEEEEEEEVLQASRAGGCAKRSTLDAAASEVIGSGGRPLSLEERAYFEPRFGCDLSAVRLHQGFRVGAAARGIGARAYTLGRNIAFAPGEYVPGTAEGRRLMAHELTHVLQQSRGGKLPSSSSPSLQRKIKVQSHHQQNRRNARIVEGYLRRMCRQVSPNQIAVDSGGHVTMLTSYCQSQANASGTSQDKACACLCDMIDTQSTSEYTIVIDDNEGPHFRPGDLTVHVPSPQSRRAYGWHSAHGGPRIASGWEILLHELCAEAWLHKKGRPHPKATRGKGEHQPAVRRENELRQQLGLPLRGSLKAAYCGESFSVDSPGAARNYHLGRLSNCQDWRNECYGPPEPGRRWTWREGIPNEQKPKRPKSLVPYCWIAEP